MLQARPSKEGWDVLPQWQHFKIYRQWCCRHLRSGEGTGCTQKWCWWISVMLEIISVMYGNYFPFPRLLGRITHAVEVKKMFPLSPSPETFRCFSSGRSKGRMIYCSLPLSLSAWGRAHRHITRDGKGYLCVYHFPGILKCPLLLASHLLLLSISVRTGCDSKTIIRNSIIQCHVQRNSWIGRILENIKLAASISSISCGWLSSKWDVMHGSSEAWVDTSEHVLLLFLLFSKSFTCLCLLLLSTQTDTNRPFLSVPLIFSKHLL